MHAGAERPSGSDLPSISCTAETCLSSLGGRVHHSSVPATREEHPASLRDCSSDSLAGLHELGVVDIGAHHGDDGLAGHAFNLEESELEVGAADIGVWTLAWDSSPLQQGQKASNVIPFSLDPLSTSPIPLGVRSEGYACVGAACLARRSFTCAHAGAALASSLTRDSSDAFQERAEEGQPLTLWCAQVHAA